MVRVGDDKKVMLQPEQQQIQQCSSEDGDHLNCREGGADLSGERSHKLPTALSSDSEGPFEVIDEAPEGEKDPH